MRDDGKPDHGRQRRWLREGLIKGVLGYGDVRRSASPIDSLWPLGDRQNRALHDHAVNTRVIDLTPPPPAPRPLPWPPPRPQLQMAPRIARHVHMARAIETRIATSSRSRTSSTRSASSSARCTRSAERAQMLHDALAETPVASIEQRLAELEGSGKLELIHALQEQLDRAAPDGGAVRALRRGARARRGRAGHGPRQPADASRPRPAYGSQELLADRVRSLRDEVAAVSEGVGEAYG